MRHALTITRLHRCLIAALFASAAAMASGQGAEDDHREFGATLDAPYSVEDGGAAGAGLAGSARRDARTFTLAFDYPQVTRPQRVSWRLELVAPSGAVVRRWQGVKRLFRQAVQVRVRWSGRGQHAGQHAGLADGVYQVRMWAQSRNAAVRKGAGDSAGEVVEQAWDIALGAPAAPPLPAFAPLGTARQPPLAATPMAATAAAALPYTVYYANLHSQTKHSDGGGAITACHGAQPPLSAPFGPVDAYTYAREHGLDILMTSEHNHLYDGSAGSNPAASPAAARALYRAGLDAAAAFNAAHPDFLALYGLEWGVINKGGHLNIFNSPELLQWERDSSGQLIGDTLTEKADYAGLYTLMRQRGWFGQFNHPATMGQFQVGGVALGYTRDGDQAMVLCEVLNTSAFSVNTSETETGRSTYEGACNKALEAGFHVAFSSNQDNHCANWGAAYSNRTGVLLPKGVALTQASFIAALRARRVFATMDKTAQLVLTANGRLMGERFTSSGPLHLLANYASSSGKRVATVAMFEGVPGRNGVVTRLSDSADVTLTPAPGEHFYYARLTQSDGKMLWSAPVWVTQVAASAPAAPR